MSTSGIISSPFILPPVECMYTYTPDSANQRIPCKVLILAVIPLLIQLLYHLHFSCSMICQDNFCSSSKLQFYFYNAVSKDKIFKRDSVQRHIIELNYGKGYEALHHLIAPDHPINSTYPAATVQLPLSQLPTQTLAQYFHNYLNFLLMRVYLENNFSNFNDTTELDNVLAG